MKLRIVGILLFLPVPIVLALFTQHPFGVVASLGLGVALMATHRLYARPFALGHAGERCLWCGGPSNAGPRLRMQEPFGLTEWRACAAGHEEGARRMLGWAHRHPRLLKIGILGGLALFLPGALAAHFGLLGPLRPDDWVNVFRLSVASAVLPLGWLGPRAAPSSHDPLPVPFPVHIQALIGTAAVVWLFRIVGVTWTVLAVLYFAGRLAGSVFRG